MSGAASEPSLVYLLACVTGVRKGKGIKERDHGLSRA